MTLRFLHLNILGGRFLDKIIEFVKKEDIDILNFQEVANGKITKRFESPDCFAILKDGLSYNGELAVSFRIKNQGNSYFGNATLFKKSFVVRKKEIVQLKRYKELSYRNEEIFYKKPPHCALFLLLEKEGKQFWTINTHLERGVNDKDTKYKLEQAKKLYAYVKDVKDPFILSGDFNVGPKSQIVSWFSTLSRNLITENSITNTLNPRVHVAKHLFPEGLAVDFVFVHRSLRVKNLRVVNEIDLSDHFGLYAEIEV